MGAYARVAPVQEAAVRRSRQSGAERGRRRILALLEESGPHCVTFLLDETHMGRRTFWTRIREMSDLVVVREDDYGNKFVGLRPR